MVNEATSSGNRSTTNGMGTNALVAAECHRCAVSQPHLSTVVLMMGINDIGWPGDKAITPRRQQEPTADDIIGSAVQQIIDRVHAEGRTHHQHDADSPPTCHQGNLGRRLIHAREREDPAGREPLFRTNQTFSTA